MNTIQTETAHLDTVETNTYNQSDVERIVADAVSMAILQYETQRSHLENAISSDLSQTEKEKGIMPSKFKERVKIGTDYNGKTIYQWVCAGSKDELHAEIARVLSGQSQKTAPQQNLVAWETIADEWFNVFHTPKVRPNTLSKDKSLFHRHVRPAFVDTPIQSITATDIQSFLEKKSEFCKSIVRDIMSMLRQIFALAVDKDYIIKNPMHSTLVYNPSKKPDQARKAISPEDQADIIAHLDDLRDVYDRHGDNMNALRFMAFLMFTGLRPCEIYGLRWEDIDAKKMELTVNRDLVFLCGEGILGEPKTPESRRTIPFDPALMQYISPIQSKGFIIHMTEKGREEEHFTEQAAYNMWTRIKKHIDVHGMTPYMARHTYATNMNKAGVPIKTAMSMMGHKDERMLLRRYTHTDAEDLTKAANSVSAYISQMRAN